LVRSVVEIDFNP